MENAMKFYVYEWYNTETGYVFYVGKGCRRRWLTWTTRNDIFKEYLKNHTCKSRVLEYFDAEEDALEYEKAKIEEYKENGMCHANLILGGVGCINTKWSDDMRIEMSINNPMKIPSIAKKVGEKHRKPVSINGVVYDGVNIASEMLGVMNLTIIRWCKQGHDSNGNPCRYLSEEQKQYKFVAKPNGVKLIVDGILFNSIREVASYIGVSSTAVSNALKENRKCKGYIINKYDNQHPIQVNSDISNLEGSETNE